MEADSPKQSNPSMVLRSGRALGQTAYFDAPTESLPPDEPKGAEAMEIIKGNHSEVDQYQLTSRSKVLGPELCEDSKYREVGLILDSSPPVESGELVSWLKTLKEGCYVLTGAEDDTLQELIVNLKLELRQFIECAKKIMKVIEPGLSRNLEVWMETVHCEVMSACQSAEAKLVAVRENIRTSSRRVNLGAKAYSGNSAKSDGSIRTSIRSSTSSGRALLLKEEARLEAKERLFERRTQVEQMKIQQEEEIRKFQRMRIEKEEEMKRLQLEREQEMKRFKLEQEEQRRKLLLRQEELKRDAELNTKRIEEELEIELEKVTLSKWKSRMAHAEGISDQERVFEGNQESVRDEPLASKIKRDKETYEVVGAARGKELGPFLKSLRDFPTPGDGQHRLNRECGRPAFESRDFQGRLVEPNSVEMFRTLKGVEKRLMLPRQDPPVFSGGDVEQFIPFKLAFEQMVSQHCKTDSEKYYYLARYTSGAAGELVRSCFRDDLGEAFRLAWEELSSTFGDEWSLARLYITRLESLPVVKAGDPNALKELALFLQRIKNMMARSREFHQLDDHVHLKRVVDKLPGHMVHSWRRIVFDLGQDGKRVKFTDLVKFVRREADIANQPVFGINSGTGVSGKALSVGTKRAYVTSSRVQGECGDSDKEESSIQTGSDQSKVDHGDTRKAVDSESRCVYCSKMGHRLATCFAFAKLKFEERLDVVGRGKLCFGCLKGGHVSRDCRNRLHCSRCGSQRHPSALHHEDGKREASNGESLEGETRTCFSCNTRGHLARNCPGGNNEESENHRRRALVTRRGPSRVLAPAVPVRVSYGGKTVSTYVILDACATDNFMSSELANRLGLHGQSKGIFLSTLGDQCCLQALQVEGIGLISLDGRQRYNLSKAHVLGNWPFDESDVPNPQCLRGYKFLSEVPFNFVDGSVGLLVGACEPNLVRVRDTIHGDEGDPYATRHLMGWALNGPVSVKEKRGARCFRVRKMEQIEEDLAVMYNSDFKDLDPIGKELSEEDRMWLEKVNQSTVKTDDGRYEIKLPFKSELPMPDNYRQAKAAAEKLSRRLKNDDKLRDDYGKFIQNMIDRGYLEKVPDNELETEPGKRWFLIHHAVYHKVKRKIRIVFDCSRAFAGVSLNDTLLKGPDLMNGLVGVLLRFRLGQWAFLADIEQMFMQIKVPREHADYMRMLWWTDSYDDPAEQYRLTSHTFGAISSPSVANFAVRKAATEKSGEILPETVHTIMNCAYMDDVMGSFHSETLTAKVLEESCETLNAVGFKLKGIVSNSLSVLENVPAESLSSSCHEIDLGKGDLPMDKVLGLVWQIGDDCLKLRVQDLKKPLTRRGMLSSISTIFDPLGFVVPALVKARSFFQETCRLKLGWDEPLPIDLERGWQSWLRDVHKLAGFSVPRCVRGDLVNQGELHVFCDGSETAYAAVAYFRCVRMDGSVTCTLLMSKSRQTPLRGGALSTIPRIELNGARLGVLLAQTILKEMGDVFAGRYFWTDSQTVLAFIRSDTARFPRFVSNRVSFIRQHAPVEQWNFVPGKYNVADLGTRSIGIEKFMTSSEWWNGPDFLLSEPVLGFWEPPSSDPLPEMKVHAMQSCQVLEDGALAGMIKQCTDWQATKCKVSVLVCFVFWLKWRIGLPMSARNQAFSPLPHRDLLTEAEMLMFRLIQKEYFAKQIYWLSKGKDLAKKDCLYRLSPIYAGDLIRVGSRLAYSDEPWDVKYPIILPGKHPAVRALIENLHRKVGHFGRSYLISVVQERFWVIGLSSLVRRVLQECVVCRKMHGRPCCPEMGGLPPVRVTPAQKPFSVVGIDFFGPFLMVKGRCRVKHYGVVFTCLASRAVHLETTQSLDTGAFINCFRRFVSRRGEVQKVYSDNGTNLVGGCREMKESIERWNKSEIGRNHQLSHIKWHFSPPSASHYGGAWEREIRTVRQIFWALVKERGQRLTGEELGTLFCEVESIMNGRPLSLVSADSMELGPLTPNHALLGKGRGMENLGEFDSGDEYVRKRWRFVQYLADEFWSRWRKSYLIQLRLKSKWHQRKENLKVGDLVLLVEGIVPRNQWPMGLVTEVFVSEDGVVRKVGLKVTRKSETPSGLSKEARFKKRFELPSTTILVRPVTKLIRVMKAKENLIEPRNVSSTFACQIWPH